MVCSVSCMPVMVISPIQDIRQVEVINWFNGDRRLSFLGMSNNVNQQNFSMRIYWV